MAGGDHSGGWGRDQCLVGDLLDILGDQLLISWDNIEACNSDQLFKN